MTPGEYESEVLSQYSRVYQFCLRLVGNPDDAEDLVQEAIIRALLAWDQYDKTRGVAGIAPWLMRIAHNLCIDWIRRRNRRPEFSVADMEREADKPEETDEYAEVLKHISVLDHLEPLLPCLEQLNEFQRIVLWLRMSESSWPKVSEITGRPIRTCRDAELSALKKLRKHLQK